jgi:hypothetical protein
MKMQWEVDQQAFDVDWKRIEMDVLSTKNSP